MAEKKGKKEETQFEKYHCLADFRTPLFKRIIKDLYLPQGTTGLDAGCGIGPFTGLLAETVGGTGSVVGAVHYLFDMLWGKSESGVSPRDWNQFSIITPPDSPEYIFNNPHYYGFYTYTMFTGLKGKKLF